MKVWAAGKREEVLALRLSVFIEGGETVANFIRRQHHQTSIIFTEFYPFGTVASTSILVTFI